MGPFSPSSFGSGAVATSALVALPASAAVNAKSTATGTATSTSAVAGYDGTAPSLTVTPMHFVRGTAIEAANGLPGCENYPGNAHYPGSPGAEMGGGHIKPAPKQLANVRGTDGAMMRALMGKE